MPEMGVEGNQLDEAPSFPPRLDQKCEMAKGREVAQAWTEGLGGVGDLERCSLVLATSGTRETKAVSRRRASRYKYYAWNMV